MSEEKKDIQQPQEVSNIRITLTSTNVKALEKVSNNIVRNAAKLHVTRKGPVRMPTKALSIATRKTPNGEGSKTWEHYEMRIHKRYIDIAAPSSQVKNITSLTIEPGVDVEISVSI
jgi:small subunit ribosomal protein S20e